MFKVSSRADYSMRGIARMSDELVDDLACSLGSELQSLFKEAGCGLVDRGAISKYDDVWLCYCPSRCSEFADESHMLLSLLIQLGRVSSVRSIS